MGHLEQEVLSGRELEVTVELQGKEGQILCERSVSLTADSDESSSQWSTADLAVFFRYWKKCSVLSYHKLIQNTILLSGVTCKTFWCILYLNTCVICTCMMTYEKNQIQTSGGSSVLYMLIYIIITHVKNAYFHMLRMHRS